MDDINPFVFDSTNENIQEPLETLALIYLIPVLIHNILQHSKIFHTPHDLTPKSTTWIIMMHPTPWKLQIPPLCLKPWWVHEMS